MSDLSYREACSLNKARGSKPKEQLKGRGVLCTPRKPAWAFIVFLPEALELSWKSEDTDMSPTEHTVGYRFSPHIRHPLGFLHRILPIVGLSTR